MNDPVDVACSSNSVSYTRKEMASSAPSRDDCTCHCIAVFFAMLMLAPSGVLLNVDFNFNLEERVVDFKLRLGRDILAISA